MDISEEYIKMSDCPEIQGEKIHIIQPYPDGNFYWDKFGKKVRVDSYPGGKDTSVWLPRQDQIQEMMGKTESAFCIYQLENGWGGEIYQDREQVFTTEEMGSPEQVWLSFYMWEKHKKKWDDEKWLSG